MSTQTSDSTTPSEPTSRVVTTNSLPSPVEQAAILMLSMDKEAAAGVLKHFSREEIIAVSQAMARLSNIKLSQVTEVIGRFFEDYKEQSSIKGASRGYLDGMLAKALGGEITRTLLDRLSMPT